MFCATECSVELSVMRCLRYEFAQDVMEGRTEEDMKVKENDGKNEIRNKRSNVNKVKFSRYRPEQAFRDPLG